MATLKNLVDETTVIKNELKTCHTNLKNNLVGKGVEVSSGDKLSNLVEKASSIEVAKKIGKGLESAIPVNSASSWTKTTINTNLNFTPSRIILSCKKPTLHGSVTLYSNIVIDSNISNSSSNYCLFTHYSVTFKFYIDNINKTSFDVYCSTNSSYASTLTDVIWEAFE